MDIQTLEKMLENRLNCPVIFESKGYLKERYFRILNVEYGFQNLISREIIRIEKELNNEFIITPVFYTPEETLHSFPEYSMPQTSTIKNPVSIQSEASGMTACNLEELALAA